MGSAAAAKLMSGARRSELEITPAPAGGTEVKCACSDGGWKNESQPPTPSFLGLPIWTWLRRPFPPTSAAIQDLPQKQGSLRECESLHKLPTYRGLVFTHVHTPQRGQASQLQSALGFKQQQMSVAVLIDDDRSLVGFPILRSSQTIHPLTPPPPRVNARNRAACHL
jgi:hypothetical protein